MELSLDLHGSANYVALSPVSFLKQASLLHGDKVSIIYGATVRFSWNQTYERCLRIASSLVHRFNIFPGDIVAAFAPNIPELYELHFAVPMAGAVISPLNIKLDSDTLALILQQLEAKIIFVDYQFLNLVLKALHKLPNQNTNPTHIVLIPNQDQVDESNGTVLELETLTSDYKILDHSFLVEMGCGDFTPLHGNINECDPISINYTSGSTGHHKGVIYSHRATYLNSLATIFRSNMWAQAPIFLWTVDMFRCNGWCFIWAIAALGGTNVCLRNTTLTSALIFESISLHKITHFCGPPTILKLISEAPTKLITKNPIASRVDLIIAGALPIPQILDKAIGLGFNVSHGYGMTEVLGPAIIKPLVSYHHSPSLDYRLLYGRIRLEIDVKDPTTMKSIPNDGKTPGEIMFKGNTIMSGYFKNPNLTQEAFRGGWYRTGDLGIRHPNGDIQMKDRATDAIKVCCSGKAVIISTIEVEAVLLSHPKVLEAAALVVRHDHDNDQYCCGFVKLKDGVCANAEELIKFCGDHLEEDYMVPKTVVFGDLPVNSTGKVQKSVLKAQAKELLGDILLSF